jgi:hypothetical protein
MMHNGWGNVQYTVHSIDPEKRLITFERGGYQHGRSGGAAPFFLENQLELLDAPGEWYQIRMVTHAHRFHFAEEWSMREEEQQNPLGHAP